MGSESVSISKPITEPSLLFLDEPTSRVGWNVDLEILQILRSLANAGVGKTIILTIHQPRIEAYKLVDNLIFLVHGGRLVYYGPAYPDAPEYFSSLHLRNRTNIQQTLQIT